MKTDITQELVAEHRLILRMVAMLEKNAPKTAEGKYLDWQFYRDGIGFIREFADRFHHAKEEDVLFKGLVENGMPKDNSPVAAMLMEHDQGRAFAALLEIAVNEAIAGRRDNYQAIADSALRYAALLRDHIAKEDDILYPLAERVLPESARGAILRQYHLARAQAGPGFSERYQAKVAKYEEQSP